MNRKQAPRGFFELMEQAMQDTKAFSSSKNEDNEVFEGNLNTKDLVNPITITITNGKDISMVSLKFEEQEDKSIGLTLRTNSSEPVSGNIEKDSEFIFIQLLTSLFQKTAVEFLEN